MQNRKSQQVTRSPVVSRRDKQIVLATLLRSSDALQEVRTVLQPTHFDGYDAPLAVLYGVLLAYVDRYSDLPDRAHLFSEVERAIDANPSMLTPEDIEELRTLILAAFDGRIFTRDITNPSIAKHYVQWAMRTVQRFLHQREAVQLTQQLVDASTQTMVDNLPAVVEQLSQRLERISTITVRDQMIAMPDDWEATSQLVTTPTGIRVFDNVMRGHAPGEAYGVLGPYGSCKTTLANMLTCRAAITARAEVAESADAVPKLCVRFSFEANDSEMRNQTAGYIADVPRESMDGSPDLRSTSARLKPYEQTKYADRIAAGQPVLGERERIDDARTRIINPHIILANMSDKPVPDGMRSPISEMAMLLRRWTQQRRMEVGIVVIDYAIAAVKRFLISTGRPQDEQRLFLASFGQEAVLQIATPFRTPVWICQQLSGAAAGYGPGRLADHSDAAECKAFAEHLSYAFVFGKVHPTLRVARYAATKTRRSATPPPGLVKLAGHEYRLDIADRRYVVEGSTIVDRMTRDPVAAASSDDDDDAPGTGVMQGFTI
jgi:replicative DNA helicase